MPNWKKVIVSGSNAHLNQLNLDSNLYLSGNLQASGSITVDNTSNAQIILDRNSTSDDAEIIFKTNGSNDWSIGTGQVGGDAEFTFRKGSANYVRIGEDGHVDFNAPITASSGIITEANILPNADNTLSLGSTTRRFQLNGGTPVTVSGTGTANILTRFQGATTVEDSSIFSSNTLTRITHDSDGNAIFIVSGSNGELLSVNDDTDGEIFRVNDDNGLAVFIASGSGDLVAGQLNYDASQDFLLSYNSGSGTIMFTSQSAAQGPTGPTGDKGQKGQTGATGPTGPKGQKGEIGPTGPTGDKGQKGQTGDKGQKGQTGEVGPTGPTGSKGQKGEVGPTGPTGSKGQKGQTGATGPTGAKGQKGQTGATGPTGDKGQKGAPATIANDVNNRVTTAVGDGSLNAETGFTFDGDSVAIGGNNSVIDNGATIINYNQLIGYQNCVSGSSGIVIGNTLIGRDQCVENGYYNFLIGQNNCAKGAITHASALGYNNTGSHSYVNLLGYNLTSSAPFTTYVNNFSISGSLKDSFGNIGSHTQVLSSVNGNEIKWVDADSGPTGPTGDKGQKGQTGATGPTGPKGQKGEVGPTGPKGQKGEIGPTGSKGQKGQKGQTGATGPTGPTGPKGQKGQKGEIGPTGPTGDKGQKGQKGEVGPTGPTGQKGQAGNFGGNSFDYTFDTSTTGADPGTGKIRLNSTTQNAATAGYIDDTDDNGNDIQSTLQTIDSNTSAVKGHIRISNRLDSTQFLTFAITDLTEGTGFWTLNLTNEASSATSPFTNNEDIIVSFVTTGDQGDKGQKGQKGEVGPTGDKGQKGQKGEIGPTGPTGPKGQKGQKGQTGATGPTGPTGDKGQKGQKGQAGPTGPTGDKGQKGAAATIANDANNRLTTADGSGGLNAEANFTFDGSTAYLDGNLQIEQQTLTDAATVSWNIDNGSNAKVTLGGNRTLSITNAGTGDTGTILVQQGTGTTYTLSLPAGSVVIGGATYTTTTTSDGIDVLGFYYDGTNYYWSIPQTATSGPAGPTGDKGQKGAAGPTGAKGQKGQTGATGPTGDKGQKGQTGATGPTGDKGQKGQTGATGPTGDKGQKGQASTTAGPTGPKGQKGQASTTAGPTGPGGPAGPTGDKGQKGQASTTAGPTGPKGQKGQASTTAGPTGPKGQKGQASTTAGPTGPKGQKGQASTTAGPTGPKGQKGQASTTAGPTGPGGPAGPTGPGGPAGPTGDKGQKGQASTTAGPTGSKGQKGAPASIANDSNDRVVTAVGNGSLNAEACMTFNSCANLTVGRLNITTTNACSNTIAGGQCNCISSLATNCHNNFIGGGILNSLIRYSAASAVVAGSSNHVGGCCGSSCTGGINSIIGAGNQNCVIYGERQGILAGCQNRVEYAHDSAIVAGLQNRIGCGGSISCKNIVGSGYNNLVSCGNTNSGIFAGSNNTISTFRNSSVIVGGSANTICSNRGIIGGGQSNTIFGTNSACSGIVTGCGNKICNNSCLSFIGGGTNNTICYSSSTRGSAILAGYNNTNKHTAAFVIGADITTTSSCYTFMNNACVFCTTRTQTLVETSAKKHKKCITSLNPQLDNIKKLSPVEFVWKDTDKEDIGFIAEDVEKILPNLVSYEENGELHGVQYSKLTAVIIKALQEQQEQIDKLKEEVELLKQNK